MIHHHNNNNNVFYCDYPNVVLLINFNPHPNMSIVGFRCKLLLLKQCLCWCEHDYLPENLEKNIFKNTLGNVYAVTAYSHDRKARKKL